MLLCIVLRILFKLWLELELRVGFLDYIIVILKWVVGVVSINLLELVVVIFISKDLS